VEWKDWGSDKSGVAIAIGFQYISPRQPKDKLHALHIHLGAILHCISLCKSVSVPWNLLLLCLFFMKQQ
jgi:hypothetical protein